MKKQQIALPLLLILVLLLSDCQRETIVDPTHPVNLSQSAGKFSVTLKDAIAAASEHYELKATSHRRSARQATNEKDPYKKEIREVKNTRTIKEGKDELIHIINYKNNKGFVLVAADNRVTPVLAFSDDGEFVNDTLPGVREWLYVMKDAIKRVKKELKDQRPQEGKLWEKYLKAKSKGARITNNACFPCNYYEYWSTGRMTHGIAQYDQDSEYSYYSPSDGGCNCDRKYAGCGPVAMAIVMRYHRHPDMLMSFNGESMMLDDVGYNAMPRERWEVPYNCGRPSDNSRRLSMLIRLNGSAASSGYGVLGNCNTWTIPGDINNAFSLMGYSNGGNWDDLTPGRYQIVKDDLRNRYPVVFTGTKCVACANSAHIWVADGYSYSIHDYQVTGYDHEGNEYCYCNRGMTEWISMNWGWGGASNGEYLANYAFGEYDTYLRALVHIRP